MKKTPFFARFLEKQITTEPGTETETEADKALAIKTGIKAGRPINTIKYPSDRDEAVTMKYPSDGDDGRA